jgi:hypothetical protein
MDALNWHRRARWRDGRLNRILGRDRHECNGTEIKTCSGRRHNSRFFMPLADVNGALRRLGVRLFFLFLPLQFPLP